MKHSARSTTVSGPAAYTLVLAGLAPAHRERLPYAA
jgi:hypothetical protein